MWEKHDVPVGTIVRGISENAKSFGEHLVTNKQGTSETPLYHLDDEGPSAGFWGLHKKDWDVVSLPNLATPTPNQRFKVGDFVEFVGTGDNYIRTGDQVVLTGVHPQGDVSWDKVDKCERKKLTDWPTRYWQENLRLVHRTVIEGDEAAASVDPAQRNKADAGKSNPLLLEVDLAAALTMVNRVLDYGAEKYERAGWKKVDAERYDAAARRHRRSRDLGEKFDAESALPHLAHEATNILFELQMAIEASETFGTASLEELCEYNAPPTGHKG